MKKQFLGILGALASIGILVSCGGNSPVESSSNINTPTTSQNSSQVTPSESSPTQSTSKENSSTTTSVVTSTTIKYTVTFESNGGTSVTSQKIENGGVATKPTVPKKTGYGFVGWYSDETLENVYDFTSIISSNITLYAKWNINQYKVTFNTKGGSEIADVAVNYNETLTKPTDPTRDGYTFAGWFTSSYYSTEYDFTKKVTKDFTLYAKWNEIPKTVSYDVGDVDYYIWTDSINTKWIKVAVPVKNTGTADLYMDGCSVDIEDQNGKLLQTVSLLTGYPEYIKPGETGYYYEENFCEFNETNIKVTPHVEIEKGLNDVIRYDVSEISIEKDTYDGVKILGRVENKTTKKGSLVKIAINLFDINDRLICT